jgi:putative hydrolase of the HAD superfamily
MLTAVTIAATPVHFSIAKSNGALYAKHMIFSHIQTWIFDLDNTLYPRSMGVFDQIEAKMEAFMCRELSIDLAQAKSLRATYWREHGTTLNGLMRVHGIDPDPFLHEVHDIDLTHMSPDPGLGEMIADLPGRKIIYTNGSRQHAENISSWRGIRGAFDALFGIEDALYVPKPHKAAFDSIIARAQIDPTTAVMFEDEARNLEVPKQLGMATVLIGDQTTLPHIDHAHDDLTQFLQSHAPAPKNHAAQ